ncbi:putative disease resistance protein RXW24L [Sesamum angolense]|uniref:Disease resistance protein RXW24L n=1 Tax=Sesamum angolense TaxID=2727404 RepID=A0AAE1X6B3_9LAMI|nr:putative disease resistance protein RXW24L [Sesamum angolense]
MSMAEFAVSLVIQSLTELLIHEAKHLPELRGRIELIQMKLRQLLSILEIADARQEADEGISNWIAETREVAYDIEDLLLVAVCSRKEGSILKKYTHMFKEFSSLHNLEPKFQVIESKVSTLQSDLRIRNIKPRQRGLTNPVSQRHLEQRRSYSHYVEEDFVGLDEDVKELVARLVKEDGDNNYQVVSITGMGGIGKTTIAKKIYHHKDVRSHFHAFGWVCVSQQWQQEDVLQRILNKLEPEKKKEINRMKVEELVEELFEVQKKKRCLIVLDDVWGKDVWLILRPAFPPRQVNSKIILTTRNTEIARYIDRDTPCYLYQQRHLNKTESWELLKKKIYRGLNVRDKSQGDGGDGGEHEYSSVSEDDDAASSAASFHSCLTDEEEEEVTGQLHNSSPEDCVEDHKNQMDMERLGKEMVGQCGGLPLAIIVLGGLLMTKSTIRNFPEDFKIPTRKLYQLWAAEGFISAEFYQAEEEESIMDIAERYLGELVQRSMVQVRVDDVTGQFKSCRLHDLTRELCLLKGKEEFFLKKVPLRFEPELIGSPSSSTKASVTRRLSVAVDYDFDSYFPPRKENLDHIRSAMFFSRLTDRRNLQPTLDMVCDDFKLLRVLDLERFYVGGKLSKAIGNLVHLRYLSLRGSQFNKLPSSIGNLKYLQTLDLRAPFLVCVTIPNVIWKLNHLKHLYLPPSHRSASKLQLGSLSKLEILKNFDTRVSDYRDISKLVKLQKLAAILTMETENLAEIINCLKMEHNHIRDSSFRIRYDFQSEREFTVLRQLVGFTHLRKLDLVGLINRLPEHCHFSQSLTKLTLRSSRLKEDPMATLEKLPNLHSLMLRKNVFEGNEISCSSQGFPQLRTLEFQGLASLEHWIIEKGSMPNLFHLKIDECINLRMVPEGIKHIATLKELVIANMPAAFKHRIQKVQEEEGEDIYKVKHIPSITLTEMSDSSMKELEKQLSGTIS